ncbi:MAG: hypothetical protein J7500_06865 [Sphingomonas sp.]|uniref:hypothetical protein n=1 Tax=Sphingomonas sp. TaxID=28214 RepID=UPI001B1E08B9|nr:hypothetical protein [Sphingomonas sp.]MBO9622415.1 hypothetical protein [Sphingomonas sp.]
MINKSALHLGIAAFAFACGFAQPAYAQATRTWVSGVGDDVNPCSRTAPCKTFAGAISKTAAGGEIDCLDPGGFGTVTVTKSITIDCTGTMGSILNSGGINGVVVNDSATGTPGTINVVLRGISINGAGTTPGLNGVRLVSGKSLVLEDVFIMNQSGRAVSVNPSTTTRTTIHNTTMTNTGGGVLVQPTGTATAAVDIQQSVITAGASEALRVDTSSTTGAAGLRVVVNDTVLSENPGSAVIVNSPAGTPTALVLISGSNVTNNGGNGLTAQGSANAFIAVSDTAIQGNVSGLVRTAGGQIRSYGDNLLNLNVVTDGTFSATLAKN